MAAKRFESTQTRVIDAPRDLVWAVVSDTNRSDRAVGLSAATYRWETDADGNQVRIASAKELGQPLEWVEPPYRWIEGRFVIGLRTFVKGPVDTGFFEARLKDADGGRTELTVNVGMSTSKVLGVMMGPVQRLKFASALKRYLDGVEDVLRGWADLDVQDPDEPAAVRIQRLLARAGDPVTVGPRTEPDGALLQRRGAQLRGVGLDREVVDRLLKHLDERPDEEVQQMRPFELASQWGLDRREVLRAFLHATVCGLTDLKWQVNCPVCRVGASIVDGLDSVEMATHCAACQIHFDTDFAQHVEAVFPSNGAVRPVQAALYCASSPAFLPHVFAQLEVEAGATREEGVELPGGEMHTRVLGRAGGADTQLEAGAGVHVVVDADGVRFDDDAADGRLVITNQTDDEVVVLLERAGWEADAVLGTVIGSFPEFVDLFATEAPRSGVDLTVGHIALLFSDLVGSTALYERVGDARAFAIVEEHFRLMADAIRNHGGAIIKTMGDAVMASFLGEKEAVAAAREMIEAHDRAHPPEAGLGVKIGVYAGAVPRGAGQRPARLLRHDGEHGRAPTGAGGGVRDRGDGVGARRARGRVAARGLRASRVRGAPQGDRERSGARGSARRARGSGSRGSGRSGVAGHERLKLTALEHLEEDVAAADELPVDVELRDGRPVRERLDALTDLRVLEDVDLLELGAAATEDLDRAVAEPALREVPRALHEEHDAVARHDRLDALFGGVVHQLSPEFFLAHASGVYVARERACTGADMPWMSSPSAPYTAWCCSTRFLPSKEALTTTAR